MTCHRRLAVGVPAASVEMSLSVAGHCFCRFSSFSLGQMFPLGWRGWGWPASLKSPVGRERRFPQGSASPRADCRGPELRLGPTAELLLMAGGQEHADCPGRGYVPRHRGLRPISATQPEDRGGSIVPNRGIRTLLPDGSETRARQVRTAACWPDSPSQGSILPPACLETDA